MPRKPKTSLPVGGHCLRVKSDQRKYAPDRQRHEGARCQIDADANYIQLRDACAPSPDYAAIIAEIRQWHRTRVYAMGQRIPIELRLGAFLRGRLGWSPSLTKAQSKSLRDRVAALMKTGERVIKQEAKQGGKRKPVKGRDDPIFVEWGGYIVGTLQASSPFYAFEEQAEENMERLARSLPVSAWFLESVFKTTALQLAVIVGEAGDLSNYSTHSKVWKRMGLAVMDGVRQGGLSKSASDEDWVRHGYSGRRRSTVSVIGGVLMRGRGHYKDIYLARKKKEQAKAMARGLIVAPSAKIPKHRKHEFMSDGHIHKMAQRYMEKCLLKDLWRAWRRVAVAVTERPKHDLPVAPLSDAAQAAAERATHSLIPIEEMPAPLLSI